MSDKTKKIGVIGGLSWVSTEAYYRRLNQIMQERLGGVRSARIALESVDRQEYVDAVIERKDEAAACRQVLQAALGVEAAGAEFIVISCNDVHRFVPEIESQISIPVLHIAEATATAIKAQGIKAVSVLGVRKTMEEPFYSEILKANGIDVIPVEESEKAYIHDRIYDELVQDIFREETKQGYLSVMRDLSARGAEGIVLGCTEIPLLVSAEDTDIALFSTTEIHCHAAIDRAIGN